MQPPHENSVSLCYMPVVSTLGECSVTPPTVTSCSFDISSFTIQPGMGSPPTPSYRFKIVAANDHGENSRAFLSIPVADAVDKRLYTWQYSGDLDPIERKLWGSVILQPGRSIVGVSGWRAYSTNDGETNMDPTPLSTVSLTKVCPPRASDTDHNFEQFVSFDGQHNSFQLQPCGNQSPYSPKCIGKTCPYIQILPGGGGEWFVSRTRMSGNAENAGYLDYSANEEALIYLRTHCLSHCLINHRNCKNYVAASNVGRVTCEERTGRKRDAEGR